MRRWCPLFMRAMKKVIAMGLTQLQCVSSPDSHFPCRDGTVRYNESA